MIMDLTMVICAYNAQDYIEGTLKSVMSQTAGDFRLLIVDDCSTDDTAAKVEDFFRRNPRQYEMIRLTENGGICNARQFALNHANTKYIIFVDADDLLKPEAIRKLYDKIQEDPQIMAATCWSEYIDPKGKKMGGGLYFGVKSREEFMEKAEKGKLFFLQIQTMFDRECALKVGGFQTEGFPAGKPRWQDYCEDMDLWTRMSDLYAEGKYFATVPEVQYSYRKSNGLSSNHFYMILKMRYTKTNVKRRRRGEKNLSFMEFYTSLSSDELKKLRRESKVADNLRNGATLLRRGRVLSGGGLLVAASVMNPRYIIQKLRSNLFGL